MAYSASEVSDLGRQTINLIMGILYCTLYSRTSHVCLQVELMYTHLGVVTPFHSTDHDPQHLLVFAIDLSSTFEEPRVDLMLPDNRCDPKGKRHLVSAWGRYELPAF
jgi:hypothetical protein